MAAEGEPEVPACCSISSLGYGPYPLLCGAKPLCVIQRGAKFYASKDDNVYLCPKCFSSLVSTSAEGESRVVLPQGDPMPVSFFLEKKNTLVIPEVLVECTHCMEKFHQVCVLHPDEKDPYTCPSCKEEFESESEEPSSRSPELRERDLIPCSLSTFLENRVNNLLKKRESEGPLVTIRVVACHQKEVEVKEKIRERLGVKAQKIPYRGKAILGWQDGLIFWGMHVQEYSAGDGHSNRGRVYISYLDSVHFFKPRRLRSAVYHEIILGYLEWAKELGYEIAHIWACPPQNGDDYLFHCHPAEQKIPDLWRLQKWYKTLLGKGLHNGILKDFRDIAKYIREEELKSASQLPYFEGDLWVSTMEEVIKEEEAKVLQGEQEQNSVTQTNGTSGSVSKVKPKPKQCKRPRLSSCQSQGGLLDEEELSKKIFRRIEKNKESFFIIRLRDKCDQATRRIMDPDPLLSCPLFDGREPLLGYCREKHCEFSSLRRVKFSSFQVLRELLKGQAKLREEADATHICSRCKTKYTPSITSVKSVVSSDLCDTCLKSAQAQSNNLLEILVHSVNCNEGSCSNSSCDRMKQLVAHAKTCHQQSSCRLCKQLLSLCKLHEKSCSLLVGSCRVPFCCNVKKEVIENGRIPSVPVKKEGPVSNGGSIPAQLQSQLQALLQSPDTPDKQAKILEMLRSNPPLLNAFLKMKQQQQSHSNGHLSQNKNLPPS